MRLFRSLINKWGGIFIVLILAQGCSEKSLCEKDLNKYLVATKLIQEKKMNKDIVVKCGYRPAQTLFSNSSESDKKASNFYWFSFTLEYTGMPHDFLSFSKELSEQAYKSEEWFSIETSKGVDLLASVQPISYLGTASKMSYLLTVTKEHDTKAEKLIIQFQPSSKKLLFLEQEFVFKLQEIKNIPEINTQC